MQTIFSKKEHKLIGISSLIISLIGIVSSISTYKIIKRLFGLLSDESSPSLQLYWVIKPLVLFIGESRSAFDVWEFFMYLLLLAGGIIFFRKKGKDTRLIAFVFSVMLLSNVVSLINLVYYFGYIRTHLDPNEVNYKLSYFDYLYPVFSIIYILISFKITKTIKKVKVLDITQNETTVSIKDTPKWQRFFHFLIDTLLMALIFCPLLFRIFESYLKKSESFMNWFNNEFALLVVLFVFRLIYYPFFEILFGSTPAKFLTESRVVNYTAEKPTSGNILQRTLCRSIPFDSVSFFWKKGWHDSLSETHVVKEKGTDYKTSYLLFLFLIFIPYITFYYFGDKVLEKYEASQTNKLKNEYYSKFYKNSIDNINSGLAFSFSEINEYAPHIATVLKVEEVKDDKVFCRKFIDDYDYFTNYQRLQQIYKKQKDSGKIYVFSKQDFVNAIPKDFNEKDLSKRNGTAFFGGTRKYEISDVFNLDSPRLINVRLNIDDFYSSDSKSKIKGISIENDGKSGKIISVKNLKGNVNWTDHFPIEIKNSYEQRSFFLNANNINRNEKFSAEIMIKDSLNNDHIYHIYMKTLPYNDFHIYQLK